MALNRRETLQGFFYVLALDFLLKRVRLLL